MEPSQESLDPISLSASPNPVPDPPNREMIFGSSWVSISTATHLSPIPTYSWEKSASISNDFSETPDMSWMATDSFATIVPETPETESISTDVPETPVMGESPSWMEFEYMSTVVPETPRIKRARRRPVEEVEWFKEFLVFLLPQMADLM